MTFNPKLRDQERAIRHLVDEDDFRLNRELYARERQTLGGIILTAGFAAAIVGLAMLTTDWFGTGLFVTVAGFTAVVIGEEVGR